MIRRLVRSFPVVLFSALATSGSGTDLDVPAIQVGQGVPAAVEKPRGVRLVEPGPWGELEYFPLLLEPPDFYCERSKDLRTWREDVVWRFSGDGEGAVAEALRSAGLASELVVSLIGPDFLGRDPESGVYEIRPSEEHILALSAEQRAALYNGLDPAINHEIFDKPYALPVGGLDEVLYLPSGVPGEQIDLIRRLTYRKGDAARFADIALVFRRARDDAERCRILKTLAREESYSVRLRLPNGSDLESLVDYWGGGGRNTEVEPILESVIRTSGIDKLDIVHLLPPTPRKLVHTFPSLSGHGIRDHLPDCFWTACSFFSEDPPDRYLDFVGHVIDERYEPAEMPARFGDLVLIVDAETGQGLHACNYIAGELVFTKNGESMGRPWIISTLDDVTKSYLKVDEIVVSFHRLRPEFRR